MSARRRKAQVATLHARRRKGPAIEEITFNSGEREEFLTGFHKRKVQRQLQAREIAVKREREERIRERQRLRDERKANVQARVDAVNAELRKQEAAFVQGREDGDESDSASATGVDEGANQDIIDHEDEYEDDEKFTTVTVEMVDVSRDGMTRAAEEESSDNESFDGKGKASQGRTPASTGSNAAHREATAKKPKKKKKKFRYESKAERQQTQAKVKLRKEKARSKKSQPT